MITWQRTIYYLGLALVEATPAALLLTLAGADAWGVLIGVALLGALADWVMLRRIRPERQSIALIAAGLLCALWFVKGQISGDYGLLGDWGDALSTIFSISDSRGSVAYTSLLAALYCFWRGTRLATHDNGSLHRLFRMAALSLMVIVGLSAFTNRPPEIVARASSEVLAFFAIGLVTIALASALENRDIERRIFNWRGMLTLGGAIGVVLGLGLLIGSLFGREVGQVARGILQAIVLLFLLILSPLLLLIAGLFAWLANVLHLDQFFRQAMLLQQRGQQTPPPPQGPLAIFPAWIQAALQIFLALLPVLLIVGLLLLARRRRNRQQTDEEERESLWSWGGLADDLRDLLAGLRKSRHAEGLLAALARLRGGDAASRVRRSYIRLLLVGEAHSTPRTSSQTPREYAPAAEALLPSAAQPVDTLTATYERARYYAAGTTDADADAAERAWSVIEQADKQGER